MTQTSPLANYLRPATRALSIGAHLLAMQARRLRSTSRPHFSGKVVTGSLGAASPPHV